MKGFTVFISQRAFTKLRKFPKDRQKQILSKIELIPKSPELLDIVKMQSGVNIFRLRIGDYRAVFVVDFQKRTINIDKIDTRQKIY